MVYWTLKYLADDILYNINYQIYNENITDEDFVRFLNVYDCCAN